MKCPACQGEWTPPQNVSLSKCPFCQTDILQSLSEQGEQLTPDVILCNMLQVHGMELLQQDQRLSAMISDLFAHDLKTKKLLLLSVKEQVPQKMVTLSTDTEREIKLQDIQNRLQQDAFLHVDAANKIIDYWRLALEWEEADDSFMSIRNSSEYYGFRNAHGVMITPFKYNRAYSFEEGMAVVELNGKCGFINKTGKEIDPIEFDYAKDFRYGLACVGLNNKYGFIDKTGNVVIPIEFDYANSFKYGLACVRLNNKYGFIDKTGKVIIPIEFDGAFDFFIEGLTPVKLNEKHGFIDKTGNVVVPIEYEEVGFFEEGLTHV